MLLTVFTNETLGVEAIGEGSGCARYFRLPSFVFTPVFPHPLHQNGQLLLGVPDVFLVPHSLSLKDKLHCSGPLHELQNLLVEELPQLVEFRRILSLEIVFLGKFGIFFNPKSWSLEFPSSWIAYHAASHGGLARNVEFGLGQVDLRYFS